jgi:hypothetical protein
MYVAINRKHNNGCVIQNPAYGRSGINMVRLMLVKSVEELTHLNKNGTGPQSNQGTVRITLLLYLWTLSDHYRVGSDRLSRFVLCVDLNSGRFEAARLRFIGGKDGDEAIPSGLSIWNLET